MGCSNFLSPSSRHRSAFISLHLAPPLSVSSVHFFDSSFPVPLSADLPRIFHFFPRQMLQSISPLFLASFSDMGKKGRMEGGRKGRRWGLSVTTATGVGLFLLRALGYCLGLGRRGSRGGKEGLVIFSPHSTEDDTLTPIRCSVASWNPPTN